MHSLNATSRDMLNDVRNLRMPNAELHRVTQQHCRKEVTI
jgi:hypothetical protein